MGFVLRVLSFLGLTIELARDDIVVFLVGPSGCGKSTFIKEVTGSGVIGVGTTLAPFTTTVQALRWRLDEATKAALGCKNQENIVFVDIPSFGNDGTAEREIEKWLQRSVCRSTLIGTIYMHRIQTDPRLEPIEDHLMPFVRTLPHNFVPLPRRVHAILSFYDSVGRIPEETIQRRREGFERQLNELRLQKTWASTLHPELLLANDAGKAWEVVLTLFRG